MYILNLPDWKILDSKDSENDYLIIAEYTQLPFHCLKCHFFAGLKKHGRKPVLFLDLPAHGKRVGIEVQRQRYKCDQCKGTFFQALPDMHEKYMMTNRLVEYIEKRCLRKKFTEVSDDVGAEEKTIRSIFKTYAARLDKERGPLATPTLLGIDELKIGGRYRCIFTDVKERRLFDLITRRTKAAVSTFITKNLIRSKVEVVCMDMWAGYKEVVQEVLPGTKIVVDKFHIVRMGNDALNTVRKSLRESLTDKQRRQLKNDRFILLTRKKKLEPKDHLILEVWLDRFPNLKTAYELKESFFNIWDSDNKEDAIKQYDEWKKSIPTEAKPAFSSLTTAMTNWREEVFSYFDYRITNAYTESVNGLAKAINREGRGYTFSVIRTKMLHGFVGCYVRRPLFGADFLRDTEFCVVGDDSYPLPTLDLPEVFYIGVDIDTLTEAIKGGFLRPESDY